MTGSLFGQILLKNQRPVKTASNFGKILMKNDHPVWVSSSHGSIQFQLIRYKYYRIARTVAGVEPIPE